MRNTIVFILTLGFLIISCSTDKMADGSSDSILGTWDLTALDIDEATATDEEEFANDILSVLSATDCYLITLTFNEDLTLVSEDATNYLEIGVNSSGTGLDVPCPTERNTETTSYTYENGVLTFIDENLETVSVNVTISGNVMVVSAREFGVENFDAGGELVFSRR